MKYFSMFSGIGGFEYGIQRLCDKREALQRTGASTGSTDGQSQQLPRSVDWEGLSCVGYSEIDKYAIQIYERNFNGHKAYGNCEKIIWDDVPNFDLLVGGFPCQAFSFAGKRLGFDDTRGTLFFQIACCLREKQPRFFLLENVKGLLSHEKGKTFATILSKMDELGYDVQWEVCNSKNFGVPQNRERVFFVGHLRRQCGSQVFPYTRDNSKDSKVCTSEPQTCPTITSTYAKNQSDAPYIVSNVYGGFNEQKPRYHGDISPTIRTAKGGGHIPSVYKDARVRRLTPIECERLQGFPDNWTEGISDTQRYKCIGNAVTTNVVTAIVERMFNGRV